MKILILRFSSIGDIVLTTPVVRCLKKQIENAEIHYATKTSFSILLEDNPYIDKLHLLQDSLNDLVKELKQEKFDLIIDLHNNLRTSIIKFRLGVKSYSFNKLNIEKWLFTNFKINKLPKIHIVDRYMGTVSSLKVKNDGQGLDYFIPKEAIVAANDFFDGQKFIALVVGAKFKTKQLPIHKLIELCNQLKTPIVLLGGKDEQQLGENIVSSSNNEQLYNACGMFNLNQSASIIQQADKVITHDTGLMHIAAALHKDIISIWGNTTPDFGMYPYLSVKDFKSIEVKDLSCRPCSKIGYDKCPKGHFDCMEKIAINEVLESCLE